ncbi:MAG: hypothetical protein M3365_07800, partial [Gemmatimonadota bacterium]|nr:hypothetical protein [Gemmatimonadota bacterium]
MTATDAAASSSPAPPSVSMGSPVTNEADFSGRRVEMAEQQKLAQIGGTAGAAAMAPEQASGQDPLQGIGQFNTGATSMMIRTGQAF